MCVCSCECNCVSVLIAAVTHVVLCIASTMQAVRQHMQLEVNRLKWEHTQEIVEIRHNAG